MKSLVWSAVVMVTVGSVAGLGSGFAYGQAAGTGMMPSTPAAVPVPAAPAPLAPDVRTGAAPDAFRLQIGNFIKGHLARVKSLDAKAVASSRDALVAEVTASNSSTSYKDLYTQLLASEIMPLVGDSDVRVRFAAGVVAAKVAGAVENTRLEEVALKLLGDKSPAVVTWGMRTASGVVARQILTKGELAKSKLPKAVVDAAINSGEGEPLAKAAVDALHLDNDWVNTNKVPDATMLALVPESLRLLDKRVEVYQKGVPADSAAESQLGTLYSNKLFPVMSQAQQVQFMQDFTSIFLLSLKSAQTADTQTHAQHAILLGKAISVIASDVLPKVMTTKAAQLALANLQKTTEYFKAASLAVPPPVAELADNAGSVARAIKALPGYEKITLP